MNNITAAEKQERMRNALAVLLLTVPIRQFLRENQPMAYAQAYEALEAAGFHPPIPSNERPTLRTVGACLVPVEETE